MAGTASDRWRIALDAFVAEMKRLYGPRLQRVILYGSRARGDAEDDSDIDTLVVLDPCADFWAEFWKINPIASHLSLEYDLVISALPIAARRYQEEASPLILNVRREGVAVG
jgi:predicted nucleotidyltransferase